MKFTAKRVWPLSANEEILRGVKAMETKEDVVGDISSNFLNLLTVPTQGKSARTLYPSLGDDPDANGSLGNAIKILEEQEEKRQP